MMKLEIDLVPRTAWYSNLRKHLKPEEWDIIRKQSYKDSGHRCAICGAEGMLNCHEIWGYDDRTHVQTLKGVEALCNSCHMIRHIGFAEVQARRKELDMDMLIGHFMKVNGVSIDKFHGHKRHSFEVWSMRSMYRWKTDLSILKTLLDKDRDDERVPDDG